MWSKSKHISCMASKINEIVNNDNVHHSEQNMATLNQKYIDQKY